MVDFANIMYMLQSVGFFDVLLPFLLVFTIVYAVLRKTAFLGDDRKIHVVVAFVLGSLFVVPHLMGITPDPVLIIQQAIPQVSVIAIAIIMALVLIGVLGKKLGDVAGILALLSLVAVVWIFGAAAGFWQEPDLLLFLADPDLQALLIVVLVFGLIIWFITKDPGQKGDFKKAVEGFTKFFAKD